MTLNMIFNPYFMAIQRPRLLDPVERDFLLLFHCTTWLSSIVFRDIQRFIDCTSFVIFAVFTYPGLV